MGYITRFSGEIEIYPPIPWGKLQGSPFMEDAAKSRDSRDLMFRIIEEAVDTNEGRLYRRSAAALVPTWADEMRGYSIVEHLQEALDAFPDHEFSGRLDCEGEETGDLWRLEIHAGRAVKVMPRIIWPDGTEEPKR